MNLVCFLYVLELVCSCNAVEKLEVREGRCNCFHEGERQDKDFEKMRGGRSLNTSTLLWGLVVRGRWQPHYSSSYNPGVSKSWQESLR